MICWTVRLVLGLVFGFGCGGWFWVWWTMLTEWSHGLFVTVQYYLLMVILVLVLGWFLPFDSRDNGKAGC